MDGVFEGDFEGISVGEREGVNDGLELVGLTDGLVVGDNVVG